MNTPSINVMVPPAVRAPRGAAWAASAAVWLAGKLGAKSARASHTAFVDPARPAAR
ncbi:hypothetical protein [Piscinibacter koreensis]|uniref:Uncharacterized protein n=1 Tax=Piscinibacter koreensis TaxID=2742824 RepID=A0A7Y6NMM2_9BURK|nr:hypothetical protein [Schlegelella koreensis]NUZ05998.1 hypothetical protein [Schlegelella koreensis]